MRIEPIGEPRVIMSNPASLHNYFAWPSVARLKNGRLAAAASGFRLAHVCPFGKTVLAFSEDEGEHYSLPAPVIDTTLDDRDGGLTPFGSSGLIVTSFTSSRELLMKRAFCNFGKKPTPGQRAYLEAYFENLSEEDCARDYGSHFRVSFDNGVSFGPVYNSPVSSPHGPTELADGRILWVGHQTGHINDRPLAAAEVDPYTGACRVIGEIEPIYWGERRMTSCEPYARQMPDGRILCHIRVQGTDDFASVFTLYQCESEDGGRHWSKPVQILGDYEGAPSHLLVRSDGSVIASYGRRRDGIGIYAAVSFDQGRSWPEKNLPLVTGGELRDLGYPMTVELKDGTLATVYYGHADPEGPAVIFQQKWRLTD